MKAEGQLSIGVEAANKCEHLAAEIALFDGKGTALTHKGEAAGTCPKLTADTPPGTYYVKIEAKNDAREAAAYTLKTALGEAK